MGALQKMKDVISSLQESVRAIIGGQFFSTSLKTQLFTLEILRNLYQRIIRMEDHLRIQDYANKKVTEALDVYLQTMQERMNHIIALDQKIFERVEILLQRSVEKQILPQPREHEVNLHLIAFLFPWLQEKTAIDVGAHRGQFLEELLGMGFQQIFAFEPNPEWVSFLLKTYSMQKALQIFPYALSTKEGQAELYLAKLSAGSTVNPEFFSTLQPDSLRSGWELDRKISVELRSLRTLIAEGTLPSHAGLLKMGTEGQDGGVLQEMPADCQYEIIIFKFWGKDHICNSSVFPQQEDIINYLRSIGYVFFISVVYCADGKLQFVVNTPVQIPHIHGGSTFCFRECTLFEKAYQFMTSYPLSQTR